MRLLQSVIPMVLAIVVALAALPSAAQNTQRPRKASTSSGRMVCVEKDINAPVSEVWRAFTTSAGAEEFFAEKANIGLAIRGPYEIEFDDRSDTKGLKILSYAPEEMISFQWNAPPEFPEVRNGGTWVVVEMRPIDDHRTYVALSHLGWKYGGEWDQAYAHFQRGWGELMDRLSERFTEGLIDWSKQRMIYQGYAPWL
jgi:uncharacterized protein YndB with AHSA1/START domain